ncbi:MAG: sodium:proton antiporter [Actinomycetota bacterium]|nr:sodium:proton antiporter [Actinomycetota bacterium]
MSLRARRNLFFVGGLGFITLFLWGLSGLPGFGEYEGVYGLSLNQVAVAQTHATNLVAAVTFGYRGFDTLGEEFILFSAVVGVAILLRAQRDEAAAPNGADEATKDVSRSPPRTSDAVRVFGLALIGPTVLFGLYVVSHGHLTPGGGFQGGVVLATAALLVYLAGEYGALRRVSPESVTEFAESVGVGAYAAIGFLGLLTGQAFLTNVLPLGMPGQLNSSGTILLINLAVGVAVAGGFSLILAEFLDQTLRVRERKLG